MELPDYEGLIEKWKVDLIKSRARMMKFRKHELPDAMQEAVLEVLDFEYDPNNSAGAKESSALTAIIDRRLRKMQRAEIRYRKHVERKGRTMSMYSSEGVDVCGIDTKSVITELHPREQRICRMIAEGYKQDEIAEAVGCSERTVRRTLCRLRGRFAELGLRGWVRP